MFVAQRNIQELEGLEDLGMRWGRIFRQIAARRIAAMAPPVVTAPVVTAPSGFKGTLARMIAARRIAAMAPPVVTAPVGATPSGFKGVLARMIAAKRAIPTTPGTVPYEVRGNWFWDPNRKVWQPNLTYTISKTPYPFLSGLGQETPWVELPASSYGMKGLFGIPWTYIGLGVGGFLVIYLLSQTKRKMA